MSQKSCQPHKTCVRHSIKTIELIANQLFYGERKVSRSISKLTYKQAESYVTVL